MLRVALKLLVYLSILTSTRTFSSYLEPQSLVNFRRSAVGANPLFLSAQQQQQQQQPQPQQSQQQIYDADTYEWQPMSEKVEESSAYFIPRLVNTNKMLYTQLSNNNRRPSKKTRKSKKENRGGDNKQLYESHIKRKNSLSVNVDDVVVSRDEVVPSSKLQTSSSVKDIVNHSNNNETISSSNHTKNEYPAGKIDTQHERELQELFGVEGARKYQEYQLKQQMLNQQFDKQPADAKDVPQKRDSSSGAAEEMQDVSGAMINQMMSRTTRRQREYDVPLIQCPPATDGMERFACPTPDRQGRYRCIDDHVLCDGFIDCPEGADEDRQACMFYKTTKAHLDVLADALLRWARGR